MENVFCKLKTIVMRPQQSKISNLSRLLKRKKVFLESQLTFGYAGEPNFYRGS